MAGLLTAPQGLGAAVGMSIGGRVTDRRGAGPVILTGLVLLLLGTSVFTRRLPTRPYWVLSAGLVLGASGSARR